MVVVVVISWRGISLTSQLFFKMGMGRDARHVDAAVGRDLRSRRVCICADGHFSLVEWMMGTGDRLRSLGWDGIGAYFDTQNSTVILMFFCLFV